MSKIIFDIPGPPDDGHPVRSAYHFIANHGPVTASQVARHVGYSELTVIGWLRGLEQQGFISSSVPKSRRRGRAKTEWEASQSLFVLLREMVVPNVRPRTKKLD